MKEIDIVVAEKIMGWTLLNYNTDKGALTEADYADACNNDGWSWLGGVGEAWEWQPSKNLLCAWQVLEKLGERYDCTVERYADDGTYSASFYESESSRCEAEAAASTAPMAICLAALKLIGVEVEHS